MIRVSLASTGERTIVNNERTKSRVRPTQRIIRGYSSWGSSESSPSAFVAFEAEQNDVN